MTKQHMIIDEIANAVDSLFVATEFIGKDSPFKWKWVAFALHHSLYSFCISVLVNSNFDRVQANNKENEVRYFSHDFKNYFKLSKRCYNSRPYFRLECEKILEDNVPKESKNSDTKGKKKLIGFWTALARVMEGNYWMGSFTNSKPLELSDEELEQIYNVVEYVRNDLVHFNPKIKGIDIGELKKELSIFIRAIKFLIKESNTLPLSRTDSCICKLTILETSLMN